MADTVDLSVSLRYTVPKSYYMFPGSLEGIKKLREDLVTLKLPHPKQENMSFTPFLDGTSECSFFWPSVPRNGILHKQLQNRIRVPFEQKEAFKRSLADLSMISIILRDPRTKRNAPSSSPMKHQFNNKVWVRSEESHSASMSKNPPYRPADSKCVDEAQMLLDDMASALRIPKQEPIEHSLSSFPDPQKRFDSVASSVPSIDVFARQPEMKPSLPIDGSPMSMSPRPTSSVYRSNAIPTPPATATATAPPPIFAPVPEPTSPESPGPIMPTRNGPSSPTRSSLKRNHSPEPDTRPEPRPPPKPQDVPTIQKLTRELWDLRRQVTAGVARETAIISELRTLNSAFIPEASTEIKSSDDFAAKTRLRLVEQELREERRHRVQAEDMLRDVQRECREPFVVPALFDAFVMISKITSEAMDPRP